MAKVGLYWFDKDLRLQDNRGLIKAAAESDSLLCVYCFDPAWLLPNRYSLTTLSNNRWRFLKQSLHDLDKRLHRMGQQLLVCYESPLKAIPKLVKTHDINSIYRSRSFGFYENKHWRKLKQNMPDIRFDETDTHTLFDLTQLPFDKAEFPSTFTDFRKVVEDLPIAPPLPGPKYLPVAPPIRSDWLWNFPVYMQASPETEYEFEFIGGESRGRQQLESYFSSRCASHYKAYRNELDGWDNSTKFSPWLANGCLSVRQIYERLKNYEMKTGANESTYWIYFELLWREYFQWYAHTYGKRLFLFQGIKQHKPFTSYYPERFQKWCHGNTPFPLVNACMKQLNNLGYLSNRGRQIVASCLVNELSLDWRFGAAYFEQQLIDYDVAVNWGNWQYLAGVGADPRGKRHFDLDKQAMLYDPKGEFIDRWQGAPSSESLDSVDAADWPIVLPAYKSALAAEKELDSL